MELSIPTHDAIIARQPIFDSRKRVHAYELLFRSSEKNVAGVTDGDFATSDVLMSAFIHVGIDKLVGKKPAFVNLTRHFLDNDDLLPNAPHKIVLEVLEDITPDDALIERIKTLSQRGFTIALDDFVLHSQLTPLLAVADIVKVELPAIPPGQLAEHVEALRQFPAKLLAEKVETQEEFQRCKDLGFELFQGYFLSRPEIVKGKKLNASQMTAMRILAKVNDPNAKMSEIESIIDTDASLSFNVLRFINSAYYGFRHKIASVKQALSLLGLNGVRNVVSLMTLARLSESKPPELTRMALIRGHMARDLAMSLGHDDPSAFYTAGLLSLIDVMLDTSLEEVLAELPLEDWVAEGLASGRGPVGELLACIRDYERGDITAAGVSKLDASVTCKAYLEAIEAAAALDNA